MKIFFFIILAFYSGADILSAPLVPHFDSKAQNRVLDAAQKIFDQLDISYAYGGYKLGTPGDCSLCTACLEKKKPAPKTRFSACSICQKCSLDCSHFVQMVFKEAGFKSPYLTTKTMLSLGGLELMNKYHLVDLGKAISQIRAGDLVVYRDHVALLTRIYPKGYANVVHATGGRDIRAPGQGVQKERMILVESFRGPLLRILRHKSLVNRLPVKGKPRIKPVPKK